jgi:hypothetical protein
MVRIVILAALFVWFASGAFLLGWLAGIGAGDAMTHGTELPAYFASLAATGAIACSLCAVAALRRMVV